MDPVACHAKIYRFQTKKIKKKLMFYVNLCFGILNLYSTTKHFTFCYELQAEHKSSSVLQAHVSVIKI